MLKLLIFIFCSSVMAAPLSPVKWAYDYQSHPEYQAILAVLKTYGDFTQKEKTPEPEPPRPMSRGQQMVEEAKARNRAILAQRNAEDKKSQDDSSGLTEMDRLKQEHKKTLAAWRQEIKDTRAQWKKEQDIFLGRIKVYQENTFEIPSKIEKIVEKQVSLEAVPDVHIIHSAFNVPIRDQVARPTCSAFAGVRGLEILLAQNAQDTDLSEQYFYWASKPNCQSSPCTQKGSWVTPAFDYSMKHREVDIPEESNCAYVTSNQSQNETQIPLGQNCTQGKVKVVNFDEVKTLAETVERLKNNIPVIMAAKLSENFYKNQGLVTLSESLKSSGQKLDGHSLGHAFLAVGVMELPEKLRNSGEGNYCIVIANSWGKGWGAGGHSCLTESWILRYRQPSSFVAVTGVTVK